MSTSTLVETDYLIIGAGAMGLAFADVVLAEHPTAHLTIVDRHAGPGGHWNDAYPFVTLHQPAAFYGLHTTNLGQGGGDLTSGPEILGYYKCAMDRFLATGRVRYLPMCEYHGDGHITSLIEPGREFRISVRARVVDGTFMKVEVPSVVAPRYQVDPDVDLVPPNGLTRISRHRESYVVIGAGKTGIDAILFLLDRGASPDRIHWVAPHDAWLWERSTVQPGRVFTSISTFVKAVARSSDVDEVFLELERTGNVARIDTTTLPGKWRCATVSRKEIDELRTIDNVIRKGRVKHLSRCRIELDEATVEVPEDTLFVDCTANGLAKSASRPIFAADRITLQPVFMCQQTFSAALIAHVELLRMTDEQRNRICVPVPHPELTEDLFPALVTTAGNMINWNLKFPIWLRRTRLNLGHEEPLLKYVRSSITIALLQPKTTASLNRMRARTRPTPLSTALPT